MLQPPISPEQRGLVQLSLDASDFEPEYYTYLRINSYQVFGQPH